MNAAPNQGQIRIEREDSDVAIVVLVGEHDLATRDDLDETLTTELDQNDLVLVDLSGATFVDSSIIAVLLAAHQRAADDRKTFRMQLHTAAGVARALEVSGVLNTVECVRTRREGLRRTGLSQT